MLTHKQYKQKWLQFKHKKNVSCGAIWKFQCSILTEDEQRLSNYFDLTLNEDDPRFWAIQQSEEAFAKAPIRNAKC